MLPDPGKAQRIVAVMSLPATRESTAASDRRWRLAVTVPFWGLLASFVVLAASGLLLVWGYRPDAEGSSSSSGVRAVHQAGSVGALWLAAGFFAVLLARWVSRRRRGDRPSGRSSLGVAAGLVAVTAFAGFTGFLLPWEQLALWAVTVGENIRGIDDPAFNDGVRFVLLGGSEVSQTTYRTWTLVHTVGVPLLLGVAAGVFWRTRRREARPGSSQRGP
jgi:quinol-cytochrome oxidoreductase complex cytochrome b subunit